MRTKRVLHNWAHERTNMLVGGAGSASAEALVERLTGERGPVGSRALTAARIGVGPAGGERATLPMMLGAHALRSHD